VMTAEERLAYHDPAVNATAVAPYVARLRRAEALVWIFPVWTFGVPAIMKGFLDRVFLPGGGFSPAERWPRRAGPRQRLEAGRGHHLRPVVVAGTDHRGRSGPQADDARRALVLPPVGALPLSRTVWDEHGDAVTPARVPRACGAGHGGVVRPNPQPDLRVAAATHRKRLISYRAFRKRLSKSSPNCRACSTRWTQSRAWASVTTVSW